MLAAAILSAIAGAILITWFLKRTTKRRAEIAFYTALLLTSPGIGDELVIILTKGSPKREEAVAWISLIQKMSAHHGVDLLATPDLEKSLHEVVHGTDVVRVANAWKHLAERNQEFRSRVFAQMTEVVRRNELKKRQTLS